MLISDWLLSGGGRTYELSVYYEAFSDYYLVINLSISFVKLNLDIGEVIATPRMYKKNMIPPKSHM